MKVIVWAMPEHLVKLRDVTINPEPHSIPVWLEQPRESNALVQVIMDLQEFIVYQDQYVSPNYKPFVDKQ